MSHRPARKSKEKKAKSIEEAKEMQRKRKKRDAWKKGAVGADECVGQMEAAIYIC